MLLNKYLVILLGALTALVGYLTTVDWTTLWPSGGGEVIVVLGLVKVIIGYLMPPASQPTIIATGGNVWTHT